MSVFIIFETVVLSETTLPEYDQPPLRVTKILSANLRLKCLRTPTASSGNPKEQSENPIVISRVVERL